MEPIKLYYKSDFKLTIRSDAGWGLPFRITFWAEGSRQRTYVAQYDGETFTNCHLIDANNLCIGFDDHGLAFGQLYEQTTYTFHDQCFPSGEDDEALQPRPVQATDPATGELRDVILDLQGETALELVYALPMLAAEQERQENERIRQQQEQARQDQEQQREDTLAAAMTVFDEHDQQFQRNEQDRNVRFNALTTTITEWWDTIQLGWTAWYKAVTDAWSSFNASAHTAEQQRSNAEQQRVTAETARQTAEQHREDVAAAALAALDEHDQQYQRNEQARNTAETQRSNAEQTRQSQEQIRQQQEKARQAAYTAAEADRNEAARKQRLAEAETAAAQRKSEAETAAAQRKSEAETAAAQRLAESNTFTKNEETREQVTAAALATIAEHDTLYQQNEQTRATHYQALVSEFNEWYTAAKAWYNNAVKSIASAIDDCRTATAAALAAAAEALAATKSANDATAAANAAENTRQTAETARQTAETQRSNAETSRATAETSRSNAEQTRQQQEQTRQTAEQHREDVLSAALASYDERILAIQQSATAANTTANTALSTSNTALADAQQVSNVVTTAVTNLDERMSAIEKR